MQFINDALFQYGWQNQQFESIIKKEENIQIVINS